jgi:lipopolysaccharide transport system ATP-binding protein
MSWSVRATRLGKRYRIGARRTAYDTLRDSLVRGARSALSWRRSRPPREHIWALRDVSFEVEPGEVLGIIGANGAGKSTLLKILSRITEPTEGRAELRGRVGSLLEVGTGFHPELTGRENIYLSGAILGMRRAEIGGKLDEIVEFAEVSRFVDTPVKHYSTGMYLRLAFAVAAHLETEILLVDEVLAVGDAAFRAKCLASLGGVASSGRTILFVSHNLGAVQQICSTVVVLRGGRVTAQGEPSATIESYLEQSAALPAPAARRATADFELIRCVIRQDGRENPPHLDAGREFEIETAFRLDRDLDGFMIGFELASAAGVVLFRTYDAEPATTESGAHVTRFTFRAGSLKAGRYFVDLLAAQHRRRWILRGDQRYALSLVAAAGSDVHLPGLIEPPGRWGGRSRGDGTSG